MITLNGAYRKLQIIQREKEAREEEACRLYNDLARAYGAPELSPITREQLIINVKEALE